VCRVGRSTRELLLSRSIGSFTFIGIHLGYRGIAMTIVLSRYSGNAWILYMSCSFCIKGGLIVASRESIILCRIAALSCNAVTLIPVVAHFIYLLCVIVHPTFWYMNSGVYLRG